MFTEGFRQMFRDWDKVKKRLDCLHCNGTGIAPGDGRTECGFCEEEPWESPATA